MTAREVTLVRVRAALLEVAEDAARGSERIDASNSLMRLLEHHDLSFLDEAPKT